MPGVALFSRRRQQRQVEFLCGARVMRCQAHPRQITQPFAPSTSLAHCYSRYKCIALSVQVQSVTSSCPVRCLSLLTDRLLEMALEEFTGVFHRPVILWCHTW
ncbi:hypothetical protein LSTR_LSTR006700 [Laodelphax striatellus]|uniref:Uncharacterized protein n=1 Tax=Laodelphax striatellus TaxID=195883 RepID=A0A482X8S4_LAOST|nr:hypothetical protein LSTR_LSTR006700 [Laodelphax striatellus]